MPNHSFDLNLATKYGVEEAILIHHFQYWIEINQRAKRNFHENRTWSYQTLDEIHEHFPYWTKDHIRDLIEKLCTGKSRYSDKKLFEPVLMKSDFNKSKFVKTLWYSFIDEKMFTKGGIPQIDKLEPPDPEGLSPTSITHTIPDALTISSKEDISADALPMKNKKKQFCSFGKYVKLQETEYEQLKILYGSSTALESMIEQMNDWILAKGKNPYKDFAAALRTWYTNNKEKLELQNGNQGNSLQRKIKTGTWLNGKRIDDAELNFPEIPDSEL
jgi:hypothetical protein